MSLMQFYKLHFLQLVLASLDGGGEVERLARPADSLSIVRNGNFYYSNIFLPRKAGSIVTKTIK